MWCKFVIVILFISIFYIKCSSELETDQNVDVTEKWRGVDTRPKGAGDWVPAEGPTVIPPVDVPLEVEPVLKRRRVRKRKRRPQNIEREYPEEDLFNERSPPRPRLRRPVRPERLDQHRDEWREEMMSEEPFRPLRPYKRRRLYPKYEETLPETEGIIVADTTLTVSEEVQQTNNEHKDIELHIQQSKHFEQNDNIEHSKNKPNNKPNNEQHKNDEQYIKYNEPNINEYNNHNEKQNEYNEQHHEYNKQRNDYNEHNKQNKGFGDQPKEQQRIVPKPILIVEKIRDPYTALQEENRKVHFPRRKLKDQVIRVEEPEVKQLEVSTSKIIEVSTTHAPIDLKALLKQAGGISLSELLQRKNLSLNDLLKGEQHAIHALTRIDDITTETPPLKIDDDKPKRYNGYRRVPPGIKKTNENDSIENSSNEKPKNRFQPNRYDFTTEATTERRIFVPSHPKYYTSVNFKPDMKDLSVEKTTEITPVTEVNDDENSVETTNSTTPRIVPTKPIRRVTLPPTLAKLRNLYAKTTQKPVVETENYPKISVVPEKAIKINLNELFGFGNIIKEKTTEGPLKISVDIQDVSEENVEAEKSLISSTQENKLETTSEESSFESFSEAEKIRPTSARDEIQEILSDTMSREQLLNILEARNMTLEELLEQRERGSSQRHLADIFHNKTKEPEPKDELIVSHVIKNKIPIKPVFLEQSTYEIRQIFPPPAVPFQVRKSDYIQPIDDTFRESRQHKKTEDYNIINNPLFRTDTKKTNEVINKLIPVWRQAYTNIHKNQQEIKNNFALDDDILLKDEAQRVEEIENQIAEAVNGALNVDTISHKIANDDESYLQLPTGVRSAVIASATIIGISVLVFITIFIIFKWSQRRHKHMSYSNSLSSLKLRSPILETQYQKRIFGTLMDSTLGRKKKLSTISSSEPHSLQDYLWENDRKPFQ